VQGYWAIYYWQYNFFYVNKTLEKSSATIRPFITNLPKIRPRTFLAADMRPILWPKFLPVGSTAEAKGYAVGPVFILFHEPFHELPVGTI
jgi:hypothetical protein